MEPNGLDRNRMEQTKTEKKFLTVDDLAEFLKLKNSSIYSLVSEGMPHFKIKGKLRFYLSEVQSYLEELRAKS